MTKRLAIRVYEGQIPKQLLFSMDETFCYFVPMGHSVTLAERGAKVRVIPSLYLCSMGILFRIILALQKP